MKGRAALAVVAVVLTVIAVVSGAAEAATMSSAFRASRNATDIGGVQCYRGGTPPTHIRFNVMNISSVAGVRFRVTVVDPRGRSAEVMSPATPGETSPDAFLNGIGFGQYLVIVQRANEAPLRLSDAYTVELECLDGAGAPTNTHFELIQDQ